MENTRRALDDDEDEDTAGKSSWLHEVGWLFVWGVLVWFGWQVWLAIRITLTLPIPFRVAALAAEAVVATVVIVWIVRLVRLFSLGNARQWEKREVEADREKTRIDLQHYYQDIAHGARREAFSGQFPKSDRATALRELDDLCHCSENMTKDWWERQKKFDKMVETRAEAIARKHAGLVALKTATSPWKIVDVLAVFYNSTRMVERIAKLYGQACSGPQALRLALRWSFNLYVAGQLGDIAEKGAETAAETAVSEIEKTASNAGTWLASALPFAGKMFAKVGEGAANYYLCWRFGRQAIEAFRPIPDKMPQAVKHRAKWTSFRKLALLAALATAFAVAAFVAAGVWSFFHNVDTSKPAVVQAEEGAVMSNLP